MRSVRSVCLFGLILAAATIHSGTASAQAKLLTDRPELEGVEVYKKCLNSSIYVIDLNSGLGQGSGFLVDVKRRVAITNHHVVGDASNVVVLFPLYDPNGKLIVERKHYMEQVRLGKGIGAKVIKTSREKDLAILELASLPPYAKAFALSDQLPVSGEPTFTIGNAAAVNGVFGFTRGVARLTGTFNAVFDARDDFRVNAEVVQATNAISPGDSGGPLINRYGQLIGVNQSVRRGMTQSVTTYISVNEVKKFLKDNQYYIDAEKHGGDPLSYGQFVYQNCVRGSVFIINSTPRGSSMGSGFLVDAEKKIMITNYHVVDESPIVYVQFPMWDKNGKIINDKNKYVENISDAKALRGKILHRDKTRDLAIVEIQEPLPSGTKAVALAKRTPDIGSPVYTIGNAGAINNLFGVTEGYVRVKGPLAFPVGGGGEVLYINTEMIQASNPINQGDSGGPLFNSAGEVVGVNQSGNFSVSNVNNFVSVVEVARYLKESGFQVGEAAALAHDLEHKTKSSVESPFEGARVYKKALNFAVFIVNETESASGSGFLVNSGDRIVVTNHHVVGAAKTVKVQFAAFDKNGRLVGDKKFYRNNIRDNKAILAKVLHSDPARDIAIIQLMGQLPANAKPIELAQTVPPIGAASYTIGNAGAVDMNFGFTRGDVRTVGMMEFVVGGGDLKESFRVTSDIVQCSNPINPGDSGGPLMNGNAELIGINQSGGGREQNITQFISVFEVRRYLQERRVGLPNDKGGVNPPPPAVVIKTPVDPKDPKKDPPKEAAVTATPEMETKAASALRSAKTLFKNDNDSDAFVAALAKIVKMYPGTKAAVEAQGTMREFKR